MNCLPYDVVHQILPYLNKYELKYLSLVNKNFNKLCVNQLNEYKNKAKKLVLILERWVLSFTDLKNLDRSGYLINYKRLYKYPEKYISKKIQFMSSFQYYPYTVAHGEIEEGYLEPNSDGTYIIKIDNNPTFSFQLLFDPFIFRKSLRVIY
ncbi:hypothetical protein CPAV1605_111 [seawater metagenome]|uniref:F-box domain-containing protein n=1 Tax=seawater metagenome TaxID=1561972 RepID=A0A5E8CIC7_9ZZZZ